MPENKKQQARKLPSLRDLINLVNFCEMEKDPVVNKLLTIVTMDYDPDLVRDILERIQPALNKKMLNPDPFSPNPKDRDADGPIKIGTVKTTGAPFGLTLDELNQHTLIVGRAGSGKTTILYLVALQLLRQGIPFWAFDFKQDYRHLLRYNPNCYVLNSKNFKFNPLRPPAGSDPLRWMQAFTNVFAQAYYLMAGTKGIIQEATNGLYQKYGVFDGTDVYPSLQDLLQAILAYRLTRMYGRIAGFVESAQNRLTECIIPMGQMFDCDKGFPIEDLLDNTIIFELDGLLSENQLFLTNIILRFIFEFRLTNKHRGTLKHMVLFDEAKMVYDRNRDNIQGLGPNEVTQFTSQIRELGEGLLVADQMPIILSDAIKSNVYSTVCMSQSGGKNIEEMARALQLNEDQKACITQLVSDKTKNLFEAIVKINGRCLTPFVVAVTPLTIAKTVTGYELKEKMEPLIADLNKRVVPRTPYGQILKLQKEREENEKQQKKHTEDMEKDSRIAKDKQAGESSPATEQGIEGNTLIRILTDIREQPFSDQQERIKRLSLSSSSSTNNKYFKELEKEELVKPHKISFGRNRGTKVFYEITDKGKEYARMKNFTIPGKGDFKHKFWQHTLKKYFEGIGYNPEIEKRYGTKNVDVGFTMNGKKIAVEVELSSDHLIENVKKDLEAGCEIIIIAVGRKNQMTTYRKKLKEIYEEDIMKKIEFRVLTDFLP